MCLKLHAAKAKKCYKQASFLASRVSGERQRESRKAMVMGSRTRKDMCQAVMSSTENLPALPDGVGEDRTHGGSFETGKKEHSQVCQHGQDISGSRGASAERQTATPESRVPLEGNKKHPGPDHEGPCLLHRRAWFGPKVRKPDGISHFSSD